ncbi:hypothetical protein SAY87_015645 [Trapa incisa]|uniref:Uncharacterized protein n=1 Tax=Trapa incisa TaxID=236973 RepID=A0AAN7QTT8_9MYRT|nr:hypothetical protein SAY87_015645 [Trapa incisa]
MVFFAALYIFIGCPNGRSLSPNGESMSCSQLESALFSYLSFFLIVFSIFFSCPDLSCWDTVIKLFTRSRLSYSAEIVSSSSLMPDFLFSISSLVPVSFMLRHHIE